MATALEEIDLEERVQAAVSRLGGTSCIVLTQLQPEASPKRSSGNNNVRIFPVCGDITMATSCTDLSRHHSVSQIGTLWLHSTIATVTMID